MAVVSPFAQIQDSLPPLTPAPPPMNPLAPWQTTVGDSPHGLVHPGNLNIWNRPTVQNADGTVSSEYSTSFGDDKGETLVPTVVGGKFLTPNGMKPLEGSPAEKEMFKRAQDHYRQTGENLGVFDNPADADTYAEALHNRGTRSPIGMVPHALRASLGTPPPISTADLMGLGGNPSMPNVFAPTPRVTLDQNPQHQIKGAFANSNPSEAISLHEQQRLAKDYQKDADPYGSADNHPGFWGKIAHGLNVATGGENRRNWEEMGLQKSLQELLKERSQEGLENANAGHISAETPEVAPNAESTRELQGAQKGNLESETRDRDATAAMGPSLAVAYSHAVNQAMAAGRDPSTDPIVQHLSDAIQQIQPQRATPPGTKTVQLEIGGKPHQVLVDERTGAQIKDLGESGEKPPSVSLNLGREEKNDLIKAYQPTLDSAERMNVMTESYEKAIRDHDQQAMLNLLANHLGMTMGLQKGSRLTKDIIHEAQQSQPWLQGIAAKFDKDGYLAGVTLSPNQMRQMVNLGQERYTEDTKKSRATAQYLGAKDDGPERVPGKATINFYLGKAGGDPNKAKELAAADGWTVK